MATMIQALAGKDQQNAQLEAIFNDPAAMQARLVELGQAPAPPPEPLEPAPPEVVPLPAVPPAPEARLTPPAPSTLVVEFGAEDIAAIPTRVIDSAIWDSFSHWLTLL